MTHQFNASRSRYYKGREGKYGALRGGGGGGMGREGNERGQFL